MDLFEKYQNYFQEPMPDISIIPAESSEDFIKDRLEIRQTEKKRAKSCKYKDQEKFALVKNIIPSGISSTPHSRESSPDRRKDRKDRKTSVSSKHWYSKPTKLNVPNTLALPEIENYLKPSEDSNSIKRSTSFNERVRIFESTKEGIINLGDTIRPEGSSTIPKQKSYQDIRNFSNNTNENSRDKKFGNLLGSLKGSSHAKKNVFYIQVLGASGVGKSSICLQLQTSEFVDHIDPGKLDYIVGLLSC